MLLGEPPAVGLLLGEFVLDLAVVFELSKALRMSECIDKKHEVRPRSTRHSGRRPSAESIGRKPLVLECDGDFVVGIAEIQIECPQLSGHRKCLVGDQAAGKRWHVETLDLRGPVLDFATA